MKINIQNIEVNYIQYGEGKDIVLLHGWGQNIQMMKPLGDAFCDKFRITILDFPGFGETKEPPEPWNIEKYSMTIYWNIFISRKHNLYKITSIG